LQQTPFPTTWSALSLPERLARVLYAPRTSFEALREEVSWQDWLAPTLLVCVLGIASSYATLAVSDPELPAVQEQLQQLTEEQRERAVETLVMWRTHGWVTMPIVNAFWSLSAVGLILLGVARWALRRDVTLREMLAVKAYGSVIAGLEWIVRTPVILISQGRVEGLTLGILLPDESWLAQTFVGRFVANIDPFVLWQVWVLSLGVSILGGVPGRRALVSLLALWGVWVGLETVAGGAMASAPK